MISAGKRPTNALPKALADYSRGVDLFYFANALIVQDDSRRLLEFSKLREDAFNVTAMTQCCGTVMCGIHRAFEGGAIWATPDSCSITGASDMAPQFYLFANDFPADKCLKLPLRNSIPTLGSAYDEMNSAPLQALMSAVRAPIDTRLVQRDYTTFDQLVSVCDVKIDNACFEQSRSRL